MAAATANRVVNGRVYPGKSNLPYTLKASAHVFRNTLAIVDISDSGNCIDFASYSANYRFVGVHLMEVHNLATAQSHIKGDKVCVASSGTIELVFTASAAAGDLGKAVYAIDNQTCQLSPTNAIYIGRIIRIIDSTHVEVEIDVDQSAFFVG